MSREEQMSDEASSNVELDLDSADKVAFDSEYIHCCQRFFRLIIVVLM